MLRLGRCRDGMQRRLHVVVLGAFVSGLGSRLLGGLFVSRALVGACVAPLDGIRVDDVPASLARLAHGRESLDEPLPDPLAGHLDEAERRDFGDLVARAVAPKAFDEPAKDELAVGLQHHVDEVDDDDPADVAQTKLTDDLLGRLEVVPRHRLLKGAPGACELAGVDVDDGHRLGPVDDQRSARRQPHLPVKRLGQLLVDSVRGENVRGPGPVLQALGQLGRKLGHVLGDRPPRLGPLDLQRLEILVEDVSDHPDGELRLPLEEHRRPFGVLRLRLDVLPGLREPLDVGPQLLLGRALGRRADDDAVLGGDDLAQQTLEPLPLFVRKFAGNPSHRTRRDEDEMAAGEGDLRGQAGALVTDRILRHLDDDRVARFESLFDAAGLSLQPGGLPIDLAGVEDGVSALADVDERRLHRRKHVLDPAKVDVSNHRDLRVAGDVVFDENVVFQNGNLVEPVLLANEHFALDRFAPRQVLGLRDGVTAPARLAAFSAALPLGFEPSRALGNADLVGGRVRRASAPTSPTRPGLRRRIAGVLGLRVFLLGRLRLLFRRLDVLGGVLAPPPRSALATPRLGALLLLLGRALGALARVALALLLRLLLGIGFRRGPLPGSRRGRRRLRRLLGGLALANAHLADVGFLEKQGGHSHRRGVSGNGVLRRRELRGRSRRARGRAGI